MKRGDIIRRVSKASNIAFGAYYLIDSIWKDGTIYGHSIDCPSNVGVIGKGMSNFKVLDLFRLLVAEEVFERNTNPLASAMKVDFNKRSEKIIERNPDLVELYTNTDKTIIIKYDGAKEFVDYWGNRKITIYYTNLIYQCYGKTK